MSSSGRLASPKQTLLSAGTEAGGTSQETLPTVANWAPTNEQRTTTGNKRSRRRSHFSLFFLQQDLHPQQLHYNYIQFQMNYFSCNINYHFSSNTAFLNYSNFVIFISQHLRLPA